MSEIEDPKKPSNVTPIEKARKGKKDDKDTVLQLKLAEIYRSLSDVIQRRPWSLLPAFPVVCGVLELELGVRLPILVAEDNSVQIVRTQVLVNKIISYCERQLASRPEFALTVKQAKEAADYYMASADPIAASEVKPTRWQGEEGLTYRRLPWAFQTGPTPTWDALMSRMSNSAAFCDWVGSIFIEESSLQSYAWVMGTGGDGKGSINRFMAFVMGKSFRSKNPPERGDKFWTHGLLGARLVTFPDCDDASFVSKGLFKSLTGGDPVNVEEKGAMSFTAPLFSKFMILSQKKPDISSEKSDLRRIIYCEMQTCAEIDPKFEQKLLAEGGYYLSKCLLGYLVKYPDHKPITTDTEEVDDIVSTNEEHFEVAFDAWFIPDPKSYVSPTYMQAVLASEWPGQRTRQTRREFVSWLERRHHVRKQRLYIGDERQRCYTGIQLTKIPPLS